MRRTKIVCTIGPASKSVSVLKRMADAGMNIVRINLSHGTIPSQQEFIDTIEEVNKSRTIPLSILLDTKGPEVRLGVFDAPVKLKRGQKIKISKHAGKCTEEMITVNHPHLLEDVKKNNKIYIADGMIELDVVKNEKSYVECVVRVSGLIDTKKNVLIPGQTSKLPAISAKDRDDIAFFAKKIDFVAQSFVRTAEDVLHMKALLKKHGSHALLIAKIESPEGVHNIDSIIAVSDAVMVARGDLGVQIPIAHVPYVQKMIVTKCNAAGKPVIVATQMLESMIKNRRPTRSEVTDIANAIYDGADATMLSGETAAGDYPIEAVSMMNAVAVESESHLHGRALHPTISKTLVNSAIAGAVCSIAQQIRANAIITCTLSGNTARQISVHRPVTPIIAATPSVRSIRHLNLWWAVFPVFIPNPENTDLLIQHTIKSVVQQKFLKKGDTAVITAGIPFGIKGKTNLIKVHEIE